MYYCDICGSPIKGEPIIVEIEGAVLVLCEQCSRRYATSRKRPLSSVQNVSNTRHLQISQTPPSVNLRVREGPRTTTFRLVNRNVQSKIGVRPERFEVVENYAELVRKARQSIGITREELARLVGVKESIIRRIEEGQLMPDVELARRLEKVLRIKLLVPAEETGEVIGRRGGGAGELTLGDIIEIRRREEEE
ncbi:MAG: TIGR00270 family protein [Crenarchaeota archaeon]|nr:TIGR00270 family protein [Thermoproteota archaeon]